MQQNPLKLFLSIVAAREEVIFMLRIIGHQFQEDCRNKLGTLKEIQDEVQKGEQKREKLELFLYKHLHETFRKVFLPKAIQKYIKITQYYLVKTQVSISIIKIYFPKLGQLLCQDLINQPSLKNSIQQMNQESLISILKFVSNFQRQKLKNELNHMLQYEQEDRCNRNEKFFSESLILGVSGLKYLNNMHKKYCYSVSIHSNRNVYDVLLIDEYSKNLYLQGGGIQNNYQGFMSLISSVTKLKDKSVDNTQSVYIPIESTQEIITQRYEKMLKEFMEQNYHVQKSVNRYYEQHKKYKMKPLPIKGYSTPQKLPSEIQSQRFNKKRNIDSGPIISDLGRYSEPISRNPLLTDSLSSVRFKQQKCTTQKRHDVILSGFVSPKQAVVRKHRSVKNYDITLLKPTVLQPYSDFPLRINSSIRKQN